MYTVTSELNIYSYPKSIPKVNKANEAPGLGSQSSSVLVGAGNTQHICTFQLVCACVCVEQQLNLCSNFIKFHFHKHLFISQWIPLPFTSHSRHNFLLAGLCSLPAVFFLHNCIKCLCNKLKCTFLLYFYLFVVFVIVVFVFSNYFTYFIIFAHTTKILLLLLFSAFRVLTK